MFALLTDFVKDYCPERYQYAEKFYRLEDRFNVLATYVLLSMLCNRPQVELECGLNGKPFFKAQSNMSLSLTHNDAFVAAVVDSKSIGIDGELWQKVDSSVVQQVCSNNEQKQILSAPRLSTVFWTAKEALSKLKNEDWYSTPRTDYDMSSGLLLDTNNKNVKYSVYEMPEGVVTVASENSIQWKPIQIRNEDMEQFINRFHC